MWWRRVAATLVFLVCLAVVLVAVGAALMLAVGFGGVVTTFATLD